jgi:signal transduction histidine kinase/CheY-like chemotaxis protein/HPt (histidine-containing phosphotransfer) domain-containing protein
MLQKKFLFKDLKTAEEAIPQIRSILEETPHKAGLITFYETGCSGKETEDFMERVRNCGNGELLIAGISIAMVAELMPEGTGIMMNLILTDESDIEVVTLPCTPGGEEGAAQKLNKKLEACDDAKAVEIFGSNMMLNNTLFMEKAMEGHEEVVLFGTSTIRNLPTKLSVDDSSGGVEIENVDEGLLKDEFIYGERLLSDGFVAVIFRGSKLSVLANYALGWSPIGRRLYTELGEKPSKGETVINRINSHPAVDIYKTYLGVYPDAFLISNICEFPFMVERDGINICLIPIDCGKDGELYFMMRLDPGEHLRLSFASHDEVLNACRDSLESMERFNPEALFLTLCGNRINFLKEDAHLEWDGFRKMCPDFALMHGACELYYHHGKGGILNSAHIAVGLREIEAGQDDTEYEHPDVESLRHGRVLPLSDRMSAFMRKITSELQESATEAREANKAKSVFLSHMSHEIRTPINAILGMDEMILRESTEPGVLDYAEDIRSAGNSLLGIVNDVLDFSKIEAGKMNIIPVKYEIRSIINDLYNVVRMRADSKDLDVNLDIDPSLPSELYGDESRIKQIISNLLTNAVKYTEEGSVTLSMKMMPDRGQQDKDALAHSCPGDECPDNHIVIRVTVKDTGIGIRPEDMSALFREFERLDEKRNRTIEGTGLGLNITRELLGLMGSRLFVESVYGKGSEFGFEIVQGVIDDSPVGEMKGQFRKPEHRQYRVKFTAEDARILVVDDTKVNLDVIRNLLKKTRITVDTAGSGAEALELVKKYEYDVIFLDHMMPGMDGPETLKRMKAMSDNISAGAPVISLTANALSGAKDQYIKSGFSDYLSKPVNPQNLEDMLFNLLPPEKIRTVSDRAVKAGGERPEGLPGWLLDIKDIDAAEGLKNCSLADVYMIALEAFHENIPESADEIEEYYNKEDWVNYIVKVHAIKSSAKLIGAISLSEQAAALEKAGHSGDIGKIKGDTEEFLARYRSLEKELEAIAVKGF